MATQLGLDDLFQQIRSMAYGIWRKRWYMMGSAWAVCAVSWFLIALMPYRYASTAQIFVDTDTILPIIAKNIGVNVNLRRQVDLVRTTLVADSNLEKIIRRSDLDRFAQTDGDMQEIVRLMKKNISVISLRNGVFKIEYENGDSRLTDRERAKLAKNVVTNLLAFFQERNVQDGQNKLQNAAAIIIDQVDKKAKELATSERSLATFRQQNIGFLGGQNRYVSRLSKAKADLKATENSLSEIKVELAQAKIQIQNVPAYIVESAGPRNNGGGRQTALDKRIAEQEKQYDTLKSIGMKARHPDVVNVVGQLKTLREQKSIEDAEIQAEIEAVEQGGSGTARVNRTPNRLYEQLQLDMIKKEREKSKFAQRIIAQKAAVETMNKNARRIPEIEAEEKALLREYTVTQKRYNDLLEQREDLEFAGVVEGAEDAVAYKVVDYPKESSQPSGPPRLLWLTASLVGGLVVGIGVAFLLSQLRPVILSIEQLRQSFDLPILGNVTVLMNEEDQKQYRKEMMIFGASGMGLFLLYFTFVAIDMVST